MWIFIPFDEIKFSFESWEKIILFEWVFYLTYTQSFMTINITYSISLDSERKVLSPWPENQYFVLLLYLKILLLNFLIKFLLTFLIKTLLSVETLDVVINISKKRKNPIHSRKKFFGKFIWKQKFKDFLQKWQFLSLIFDLYKFELIN